MVSSRADVLGSLLEAESTYEAFVSSNQHVSSQVAAEAKKRGSLPTPADFNKKHPRGGKGSASGGKFVKKGSSGTPVKEVQKRLGIAQTGAFAYDTVAAVKEFQREKGLQVDGVVGRQTAQALLGNRNAKAITPGVLSTADAKALGVSKGRHHRKHKPKPTQRIGGGVWV